MKISDKAINLIEEYGSWVMEYAQATNEKDIESFSQQVLERKKELEDYILELEWKIDGK
jgi:hypothetical protein